MFKISPSDLEIVKQVLRNHVSDCEVRVFGSRVNGGEAKKYSDLDLVIIGRRKLSARKLTELKGAFQESDLSIRVDILDWHRIPARFKKVIDTKYEVLQNAQ
ncbi:MAG: nucleotidyltransferase domain-containing protein [Candidatus Omnitrophica bacterium]|nr:nucleotidyltransferase domain-containing protein [Candidatus Omnitrophota bacterium]